MNNKDAIEHLKSISIYSNTLAHWERVAIDKAIASLECIDEIIELIKNSSDKQYRNNHNWIYIGDKKELADVLDIINKHLGV